ncbi:MAG: metal-dependent hydrolase [Flavobacteriaceae bacterium]
MASFFGHALTSIAIGKGFSFKNKTLKFWILAIFCAVLPDADVISFKLGIPYASFWGHRGFTHSILFALLVGVFIALLFYRSKKWYLYAVFFFLATVSHTLLDALTNGGLGVALFSPFDNTRYFFPWRPIQVSPIGIENFLSERGWRVIKSELFYIGIPSIIFIGFTRLKAYLKKP